MTAADATLTRQNDEWDDNEISWSTCAADGCDELVPLDAATKDGRLYCDDHWPTPATEDGPTEVTRKHQDDGPIESSLVVMGLEKAYEDIRARHPDAPPVVIALAGSRSRRGHFAANRWERNESGVAELFIAGERLRDGAQGVLATLLHETAHGLASTRGIPDTSRGGRYHNRRYKLLAEEVGLHVERAPSIGWSDTSLTPETIDDYASDIGRVDRGAAHVATPRAGRPNHGRETWPLPSARVNVASASLLHLRAGAHRLWMLHPTVQRHRPDRRRGRVSDHVNPFGISHLDRARQSFPDYVRRDARCDVPECGRKVAIGRALTWVAEDGQSFTVYVRICREHGRISFGQLVPLLPGLPETKGAAYFGDTP